MSRVTPRYSSPMCIQLSLTALEIRTPNFSGLAASQLQLTGRKISCWYSIFTSVLYCAARCKYLCRLVARPGRMHAPRVYQIPCEAASNLAHAPKLEVFQIGCGQQDYLEADMLCYTYTTRYARVYPDIARI